MNEYDCSNVGNPLPDVETSICMSRGLILAGVLDGTSSYSSVGVFTDTSSNDLDEPIEYDANLDSRLDKFDARELGIEYNESEEVKSPSGEASERNKL